SLSLIAPHIEQLLADSVFGCVAILDIGLKERLARYAALQHILEVVLIENGERFGRDRVVILSAALEDSGREPSLFNPGKNLRSLNSDGTREAIDREEVAANFAEIDPFPRELAA